MKLLNGQELAEYIQERQVREVRSLRQAHGIVPRLAIIVTIDHPAIDTYIRRKRAYGADIAAEVDVHRIDQSEALATIARLNADPAVQGIIVQLPLADPSQTDEICNTVLPAKDVDALSAGATLDPATPLAILWLLAGYNIDLKGKHIVLVGRGRLVGAPLERILRVSGQDVLVVDRSTPDIAAAISVADIIITATGTPGLITTDMIKHGAVVVDAGVAGEQGKTVGDVAPEVYERTDITITPTKGGVGPLTICALFDNLLRAARISAKI